MRDDPGSIIFFAAGFGTRMRHLTEDRPKPLVRVAGKALLDHALDQAEGLALKKVVNTHYLADQIETHLKERDLQISHEADILETGGGLIKALPLLGSGPVVTMNTDAVWGGPSPISALLETWDPDQMEALLMCIPRDQAIGHTGKGDFVMAPDGRLSFGPGDVYTGVQIIRTELLHEIAKETGQQKFSLRLLWEKLLAREKMYGMRYIGQWCDVGTPEGVALAEEMLARHV